MISTTTTRPRIYVACLAAYNNGRLYGEWIDAAQHQEDIQIEIDQMLLRSPEPIAEDWAIHDSENFGGLLGEHEDLEKVSRLGQAIEEHGEAFIAFCKHEGVDDATAERFEYHYRGEYNSEEEFTEEWYRELYTIPSVFDDYIEWDRMAYSLFIDTFYSVDSDSGVYVFSLQ